MPFIVPLIFEAQKDTESEEVSMIKSHPPPLLNLVHLTAKAQILYGFELFSFTPVHTKSSEITEKGTKRVHSYPLNRGDTSSGNPRSESTCSIDEHLDSTFLRREF